MRKTLFFPLTLSIALLLAGRIDWRQETGAASTRLTPASAAPAVAGLVINEFLADPPGSAATDLSGDANGDGKRHSDEDEFVEIVNAGETALDVSGYVIRDSAQARFTFPSGTVIPPGEATVIFGGGNPTGPFGKAAANGLVFKAATGLSLNNAGDTITLQNASGVTIASHSYGSEGGQDQSLSRNPDITGNFTKHKDIPDSGGKAFSPGRRTGGANFSDPLISSITPTTVIVGDGEFTLQVDGANFKNGAKIIIGSSQLSATFISSARLTAQAPTSLTQAIGTRTVKVENPDGAQSNSVTLTVAAPLIINEFLADPPGSAATDLIGDANGDGARSASDDEFIEIINISSSPLDVSNYSIKDSDQVRHTFALGAVIPAGEAAVIFGGGAPTGQFGNAAANGLVFTASGGSLSLSNSGDTISLLDPAGGEIARVSYTSSAGSADQSLNRNPDITGSSFVNHSAIGDSAGALFSPGKRTGGSAFTPAPRIDSLNPSSVDAGSAGFILTINGADFDSGAKVFFSGAQLNVTFNSPSQLQAETAASLIASAGTRNVQVINGKGNRSNIVSFSVAAAAPRIDAISPSFVVAGGSSFTLTVFGSSFQNGASVRINGAAVTTSFDSATKLTAQVAASFIAAVANLSLQVVNPDGRSSNSVTLPVEPPAPIISSISPSQITVGSGSFSLRVSGANFENGASVRVDSVAVPTTFISSQELIAAVGSSTTNSVGSHSVEVRNPSGKFSNAVSLSVILPAPAIVSLSPNRVEIGSAPVALTVDGLNFRPGAVVKINGVDLPTTFISAERLTVLVPAIFLAAPGNLNVIVVNADGQASNIMFLPIVLPPPLILKITPDVVVAGSASFTLTIEGANFQPGATLALANSNLPATFVSSTKLTVTISSDLIKEQGPRSLQLINSDGRRSNLLALIVEDGGSRLLVINEFLPDPPDGLAGDANGDGSRSPSQDEFIEIVNRSDRAVDISGFQLSDSEATRHIFAEGTMVPAGEAVVIFGGGTPSGRFGNAMQNGLLPTASTGALSLSNTGDIITLVDRTGKRVDRVRYDTVQGSAGQSINRSPDVAGAAFLPHSKLDDSKGALFSPGTSSNGSAFTRAPRIDSVSPATIIRRGASFTITVTGADFDAGASVRLNTVAVSTTFISSTQLKAEFSSGLLEKTDQLPVQVVNAGGNRSNLFSVRLINPAPKLTSLSPDRVMPGSAGFQLTLIGEDFLPGAVAQIDGVAVATTFDSSTRLFAQAPASKLVGETILSVRVRSADGQFSNDLKLLVVFPVPNITAIEPTIVVADSGDFTLTVEGSDFRSGAQVLVDGISVETVFQSKSRLSALLTNSLIANARTRAVQAQNPDGKRSNIATLTIEDAGNRALVINEFLADPPDGPMGDANGDGVRSSSQDEFVEIVNTSSQAVDISGYTLSDSDQVRHVFSQGTIVPAGEAVVIFGGGAPKGSFGNARNNGLVFTASSGGLSLGNSGDIITLNDAADNRIDRVRYGSELGSAQVSINRKNDVIGKGFQEHSKVPDSNDRLFSPGLRVNGQTFTFAPRIDSLAPAVLIRKGESFTLLLTGAGFESGATVIIGRAPIIPQFISTQQLRVSLSAALIPAVGEFNIHVINPGGNRSNIVALKVVYPPPKITSLSPGVVIVGSGRLPLTVDGEDFLDGAEVQIDGASVATRFVSSTQLVAQVPAGKTSAPAVLQVRVVNRDGQESNAATLSVIYRAPSIASISPETVVANSGDFLLKVNGADFRPDSAVLVGQTEVKTQFESSGRLSALVENAAILSAGALVIQVRNADGQRSNGVALTVEDSGSGALVINEFLAEPPIGLTGDANGDGARSPSQDQFVEIVNTTDALINIGGYKLSDGDGVKHVFPQATIVPAGEAVIVFGGGRPKGAFGNAANNDLVFVASTGSLALDREDIITLVDAGGNRIDRVRYSARLGGTSQAAVRNPDVLGRSFALHSELPGGGPFSPGARADGQPFTVAPKVIEAQPQTLVRGSARFLLTIIGANFEAGAVIAANQTTVMPLSIGDSEIRAELPRSLVESSETVRVQVVNPRGNRSNSALLKVMNPPPRITRLSPGVVIVGSGDIELVIEGGGFSTGARVLLDGAELAAGFDSASRLVTQVPASKLATVGIRSVQVINSDGQSSNEAKLLVIFPAPALTGINPDVVVASSGDITMQLNGSNFRDGARAVFDEIRLQTVFGGPGRLSVELKSDLLVPGAHLILVENTDGQRSRALTLTVEERGARSLVINEFLASPPDSLVGDANGDGIRSSSQDEFIEIVNATGAPIDISGYSISDDDRIRHTFAPGAIVPAGEAVVIFGGGAPKGRFGNARQNQLVFTASTGSLSLNDDGDVITLIDRSGNRIDRVRYDSRVGGARQSVARAPDILGQKLLEHSKIADASGALFSPGLRSNGSAFQIAPRISSISPQPAEANMDFEIEVQGEFFEQGARLLINRTLINAVVENASRLRAAVRGAIIAEVGSYQVVVINPGGNRSEAAMLIVVDTSPKATSLAPARIAAGSGEFELTVTGLNFVSGAKLVIGDQQIEARLLSSTQLSARIPGRLIREPGTLPVSVRTPDGRASSPLVLTIEDPGLVIFQLKPESVMVGSDSLTVRINGGGFSKDSILLIEGAPVAADFASFSQATVEVPSRFLARVGARSIQVKNPDGKLSGEALLKVVGRNGGLVVINEFLADPPDGAAGDANNDDVRSSEADEFVEIVNGTDTPIDISGYSVSDSERVRHTFPANTLLPAGEAVIVFGGGRPRGPFGNASNNGLVFTASSGSLSLSNSGDQIALTDADGLRVDKVIYTAVEGGAGRALNRGPDVIGAQFVAHTALSKSDDKLFSPGTRVDGALFTAAPRIDSLDPAVIDASDSPIIISISGENFSDRAGVRLGIERLEAKALSPTGLRFEIPASFISAAGALQIRVINSDGNRSNAAILTVLNRPPRILSLTPERIDAGSASFELAISGADFQREAMVEIGAERLTPIRVTPAEIVVRVTEAMIEEPKQLSVRVINADSRVSNEKILSILNPGLRLVSIEPEFVIAGRGGLNLKLRGSGFQNGSSVLVDGRPAQTAFLSFSRLSAQIPAELIVEAGMRRIRVRNEDGNLSDELQLAVLDPLPRLAATRPARVGSGASDLTVTLQGSSFQPGAAVRVNNRRLSARFINFQTLSIIVPERDLARPGKLAIKVINADGGESNALDLEIGPGPLITRLTPEKVEVGAEIVLKVGGLAFQPGVVCFVNGEAAQTRLISDIEIEVSISSEFTRRAGEIRLRALNADLGRSNEAILPVVER